MNKKDARSRSELSFEELFVWGASDYRNLFYWAAVREDFRCPEPNSGPGVCGRIGPSPRVSHAVSTS